MLCGFQVLDPHPYLTMDPRLIKTETIWVLGGMFLPHCPLKLPVTVVTLNPLMKALEVNHAFIAVSNTHQSHMLAQELEMLQVLASASSQSLKAYGSQQMSPS